MMDKVNKGITEPKYVIPSYFDSFCMLHHLVCLLLLLCTPFHVDKLRHTVITSYKTARKGMQEGDTNVKMALNDKGIYLILFFPVQTFICTLRYVSETLNTSQLSYHSQLQ